MHFFVGASPPIEYTRKKENENWYLEEATNNPNGEQKLRSHSGCLGSKKTAYSGDEQAKAKHPSAADLIRKPTGRNLGDGVAPEEARNHKFLLVCCPKKFAVLDIEK